MKILKDIFKESNAIIKLHKVSEKIPIQKGARHSDTISPKLSITVLGEIFKNLDWKETRIQINGKF